MIDNNKRYQKGLKVKHLFPNIIGLCSCGCGEKLTGKKTKWASEKCSTNAYITTSIIKGNIKVIRTILHSQDMGYCRSCGQYDAFWNADHIIPVMYGGGAMPINNFQTLCVECHKEKTKYQLTAQRNAISSHAAVNASTFRLYEEGDTLYSS